jgi:D-sedoheptulose 7-phosphate isomerase
MFKDQVNNLQKCLDSINFSEFQQELNLSIEIITDALVKNKPLLVCGNGGSAADSQHIAGELVGKFLKERRALNVKALTTDTSVITAWANDVSYDSIFSRQVEAYSQVGGVLLAISTSGSSKNVVNAAIKAKELGMSVIVLTGANGGVLENFANVILKAPSTSTPRIQEMHVMIYHYLCEVIEKKI